MESTSGDREIFKEGQFERRGRKDVPGDGGGRLHNNLGVYATRCSSLATCCEADDSSLESVVRKALEKAVAQSDGRLLAIRLQVIGRVARGQALRDRLDAVAVEVGDVWLEKIVVTAPASSSDESQLGSTLPAPVTTEIQRLITSIQADDGVISQWMAEFAELRGRFAGELGGAEAVEALSEKQAFRNLLGKVGGQLQ